MLALLKSQRVPIKTFNKNIYQRFKFNEVKFTRAFKQSLKPIQPFALILLPLCFKFMLVFLDNRNISTIDQFLEKLISLMFLYYLLNSCNLHSRYYYNFKMLIVYFAFLDVYRNFTKKNTHLRFISNEFKFFRVFRPSPISLHPASSI